MTDTARLALLCFHGRALLAALPQCRCGALATRRLDVDDPHPLDAHVCDLHAGHPDHWPELPHAASARAVQAALDAPAGPAGPVG